MSQKQIRFITENSLYLTLTASIILCSGTTFSSELPEAKTLVSQKIVTISQEELHSNSKEAEEKFIQAARQGFFYMEIPEKLKDLVKDVEKFAHNIYKDADLKGKKFPGTNGYHEFGQTEAFISEDTCWNKVYPEYVQLYAKSLRGLAADILRKIFPIVLPKLKENLWNEATGGLFEDKGMYHLSFNHCSEESDAKIGYPAHNDVGFITILFINKEGLYAEIDNEWQAIPPKKGHFVINFGNAFELLVNDPSKLAASWHAVKQRAKDDGDRISFGLFTNNNWNAPVMRATKEGTLEEIHPSYRDYFKAFLSSFSKRAKNKGINIVFNFDEK